MKGKIFSLVIVVLIAAVVLFTYLNQDSSYAAKTLRKFESSSELENYIKKSQSANNNYRSGGTTGGDSGAPTVQSEGAKASMDFASSGGADYSKTNIQVEGVDEADIVKNDGKYIYTVNQNKVLIVEAYPADSMKIVKALKFNNSISGIFIKDDKLVVIESSYGYVLYDGPAIKVMESAPSILPPNPSKSEVIIHIYDTDDFNELKNFSVDGNYYTARLIDDFVYIISNKYIQSDNFELPVFRAGNSVDSVAADRIYYPGYYDSNLIFTSVMAIDLGSLEYKGDVFLIGASSTIYVSTKAIYLTSPKTYDWNDIQEKSLQAMVNALPSEIRSEAQDVIDSDSDVYIKQEKINNLFKDYFNVLSAEDKISLQKQIDDSYNEFYSQISKEYEKTSIHKIEIDGLDISYYGTGEVPGYLLNQFSMDENEGYFRVATTTGNIWNSAGSLNHLYVLNDNLEIVGSVEDLASGERIYSTRFVGDKAYMVTFRQVDPLYVIDLSNPKNPKVLGYLKVTGFSNYLHPVGDNLLLGIGHEASHEGRAQGLKIALFDVSDFVNPREVDKYVVESPWSYSEAEYEHKAVLFDDKKDLLVIPVTYSQQLGYKWEYWQGAFVFGVTDTDVSLKAKIDHELKVEQKENQDYGLTQGYVKRSVFIENNLYTISDNMIKANNLNDFTEAGKVDLPFENYYGPIIAY